MLDLWPVAVGTEPESKGARLTTAIPASAMASPELAFHPQEPDNAPNKQALGTQTICDPLRNNPVSRGDANDRATDACAATDLCRRSDSRRWQRNPHTRRPTDTSHNSAPRGAYSWSDIAVVDSHHLKPSYLDRTRTWLGRATLCAFVHPTFRRNNAH